LINRAQTVYDDLLPLKLFIPDISQVAQLLNVARSYDDSLNNYSGTAKDVELAVFILSVVLYCLIVGVTLLSLLAGCLRMGKFLLAMSWIGWVGLLIIWIVCGIYLSGSVTTADVCETSNRHLLDQVMKNQGSVESSIVAHYILCNGSDILQQLDAEASELLWLATQTYDSAVASGNKTATEYWGRIVNSTKELIADYHILEDCTDTFNNVKDSKYEMCTNFMVGEFIVMVTLFFTGVLGISVWILGLIEDLMLRRRVALEDVDYLSVNAGAEKTPLVKFPSRSSRSYEQVTAGRWD